MDSYPEKDMSLTDPSHSEIKPAFFQKPSDVLGITLHHVAMGNGQPVILLHGIAASLHDWEVLLPELASYHCRGLAVDLMGHGESHKPEEPASYTSEKVYSSFRQWLNNIVENPPFDLVGHSYGGYLSLLYALEHPHMVRRLVLIDPLYSPRQLSPILRLLNRKPEWSARALDVAPLGLIDFFLGWDPINAAQFAPQARWQIAVDYKRASPYILRIPSSIRDLTPLVHKIQNPTLVLWGDRDLTLRPDSFSKLVSLLPNAKGKPISQCGHQPHIGKPKLTNRFILDFLLD